MHERHNLGHHQTLLELDPVITVNSNQRQDEVGAPADQKRDYHREGHLDDIALRARDEFLGNPNFTVR